MRNSRENLTRAAGARIALIPSNASFGKISAAPTLVSRLAVRVQNLTGTAQTFSVSALRFTPSAGPVGSVYGGGTTSSGDAPPSLPATVTVPAGGHTTLTVAVRPGQPLGSTVQGCIQQTGASGSYHFAYLGARRALALQGGKYPPA